MKATEVLALVLRVAFRNIWLYRFRTVVVAGLLGFGAFLAVFGLSLLRDVEASMRASITQSVAGDAQAYAADAKDELALFGGSFMGRVDVGALTDMTPYREALLTHPNVRAFVPMGIEMAMLGRGNEMDDVLDALREALRAGDPAIVADRIDQVRLQIRQLELELAERRKLAVDQAELDQQAQDLATAKAPGFLDTLQSLDETKLQFLETRIAPLSGEKQPIYLNFLGTDIALYRENFPKFKVVEGEPLPPGTRGVLLSRKVREDWLKNMVARLFDRIDKRRRNGTPIAGDPENERNAGDLPKQVSEIVSHLDRREAEELTRRLQESGFAAPEGDVIERLTAQLRAFLTVSDQTFDERRAWFYEHVAPKIRMYEISPGETIVVRSYTRSGYVKSLPLRVFGVYGFDGLEDSDLAGAMNLIDLVSFRELYGQMTEASRQELEAMRQEIGLAEVTGEDAEAALFGEARDLVVEGGRAAEPAMEGAAPPIEVKPVLADRFDPEEVRRGLALNAALILRDPDRLDETLVELRALAEEKGLALRLVDWQAASGIVGQFVNIVRLALVFALVVIFIVALVIINNTIIVSTLNRTREIGTMRAIGAQKSFVVGLFLAETGITGLVGALVGTTLAAALLAWLTQTGIPSGNDVVTFLFSGPRLYPTLRWPLILTAPVVVTAVATLASIYAARHAAHVRPAEALQEKE